MPKRKKREEEADLEAVLFGDVGGDDAVEGFGDELNPNAGGLDFALGSDVSGDEIEMGESEDGSDDEESSEEGSAEDLDASAGDDTDSALVQQGGKRAAWEDDDDDNVLVNVASKGRSRKLRQTEEEEVISGAEYAKRLRDQFGKHNPSADWAAIKDKKAALDSDDEEESEGGDESDAVAQLGRVTGKVVSRSRKNLPAQRLDISRLKNANQHEENKAVVQSVSFHPNSELVITAGFDKTIRMFQVDGVKNAKVQSIFVPDLPMHKAQFTADGNEIIAAGRRKYFYFYDVHAGKIEKVHGIAGRQEKSFESFFVSPNNDYITFIGNDGYVVFVDRKSKQWAFNLKMNGTARSVSFSPDGNQVYTSGGGGEVYVWDVRTRRCLHRAADEGALSSTALSVSPNGQYYATGADSGVVNMYKTDALLSSANPKPLKCIMSLTTPVTNTVFHPDSQVMALFSREKKDQLRMLHVPSLTVFSNWPTSNTPLGYVSCADFSPNGVYFATGNAKGKVLLYRLNHYTERL